MFLLRREQALEIDVVHDIPVKVMPANEASCYRPPDVQMPQVEKNADGEKISPYAFTR